MRFTQQHNYSQLPKAAPLRHQQEQLLPDMLTQFSQMADTLFYEVLDLPLPQLERLKTLKARELCHCLLACCLPAGCCLPAVLLPACCACCVASRLLNALLSKAKMLMPLDNRGFSIEL